jgi:hypothetical protein
MRHDKFIQKIIKKMKNNLNQQETVLFAQLVQLYLYIFIV